MRVFRVLPDVARYRWIIVEPESVYSSELLTFDCEPKVMTWAPPSAYVHNPKQRAGDFLKLVPGALVCEPRATELLRGTLEIAGELLPLPLEHRVLTVLNVLECVNCLDETRSEFGPDTLSESRYVFLPSRFASSTIFKIPQTARTEILTLQGRDGADPEEEFKSIVEMNDLKGLTFELLWEGDQ